MNSRNNSMSVISSPTLNRQGSQASIDLVNKSKITGTKEKSIEYALSRHENASGPGQYEEPNKPLIGGSFAESNK